MFNQNCFKNVERNSLRNYDCKYSTKGGHNLKQRSDNHSYVPKLNFATNVSTSPLPSTDVGY